MDGGSAGDAFGTSVADAGDVDGDGISDIISGAPGADPGGLLNAGSVYVYSGATGALLHQFDGTAPNQWFGQSVAGAGDVDADGFGDLIIGSPVASPNGVTQSGSMHVYSGSSGALLYQVDGAQQNGHFGFAVSSAADFNQDGYDDFLIGAPDETHQNFASGGAVYVYSGIDGSLLGQVTGADHHEDFGYAVSLAGDCNGDGLMDFAVGAPGAHQSSWLYDPNGAAYVHAGGTGARILSVVGSSEDQMGRAVAAAGDVNNDGYDDIVVGAPDGHWYNTSWIPAYAIVYSGRNGQQLHRWPVYSDFHGYSVAGVGDINADGHDDVLVGTPGADLGWTTDCGTANVYSGASGSVLLQFEGEHGDQLGFAVAGVGDVDGNGTPDFAIASPYRDVGATNTGTIEVIGVSPFLTSSTNLISASSPTNITLELDFPQAAANYEYRVLLSTHGTGPYNLGVDIPLSADNTMRNSWFGIYPFPNSTSMQGTLDANGKATAIIAAPAHHFTRAIGAAGYLAAVAMPAGSLPEFSSRSVTIFVQP